MARPPLLKTDFWLLPRTSRPYDLPKKAETTASSSPEGCHSGLPARRRPEARRYDEKKRPGTHQVQYNFKHFHIHDASGLFPSGFLLKRARL